MSNPKHYDLVIIGAGIQGAGTAQAAAAKGHSVLVLEKNHVASGTSSKSSKLIHGGLRYLESAQFGLVRECLRERDYLLHNAPQLVQLEKFYFPIYQQSKRHSWQLFFGLTLYHLLGGLRQNSRFRHINVAQWQNPDGLKHQELKSMYQYWDGVTDDAKLTQAVVQSACKLGAELKEQCAFLCAHHRDHNWQIEYNENGQKQQCSAQILINAAGPWVNLVASLISPKPPTLAVDLVQGTHILIKGSLQQGIYYVEAPEDGRMVFFIPKNDHIMVGTTETLYQDNPDDVVPLQAEIDYLLRTLSFYFPQYANHKIEQAFAGLRVLPKGQGSAFSRPRDTLFVSDDDKQPKYISIYGGKLTAYRAMAEKLMALIEKDLVTKKSKADTRYLKI